MSVPAIPSERFSFVSPVDSDLSILKEFTFFVFLGFQIVIGRLRKFLNVWKRGQESSSVA